MRILFYALTPIFALVLELIFRGVFAILSGPIVLIQQKIDRKIMLYKFRADMIVSGYCAGLTTVYLINFANNYFGLSIASWWIVCSICLIILKAILGWDRNKPFWYEVSLNVSPWIGYITGILLFLN